MRTPSSRRGARARPMARWLAGSSPRRSESCTAGMRGSGYATLSGTKTPWSKPRLPSSAASMPGAPLGKELLHALGEIGPRRAQATCTPSSYVGGGEPGVVVEQRRRGRRRHRRNGRFPQCSQDTTNMERAGGRRQRAREAPQPLGHPVPGVARAHRPLHEEAGPAPVRQIDRRLPRCGHRSLAEAKGHARARSVIRSSMP